MGFLHADPSKLLEFVLVAVQVLVPQMAQELVPQMAQELGQVIVQVQLQVSVLP